MDYKLDQAEPAERILTQKMKIATLAHFNSGVPIDRLGLNDKRKDILARVEHVYWQYVKNPFLEIHALFYAIHKGKGMDQGNASRYAKDDERVFWFVVDNCKSNSRKDSEMKVRAAADKLMHIGMDTDNVQALHKGADLRMRLDRLDQPESEQADMSKVAFLPSVVVTDIREVDDTKENYDDETSKNIMRKYNAYVDEKRTMVDEKVAVLEAGGGTDAHEANSEE